MSSVCFTLISFSFVYVVAIAITCFGILFTLGVDQVAMYLMTRLNYSATPTHLEPISDHGCNGDKGLNEHSTQSHHHEDHKHALEDTNDGSIVSASVGKSLTRSDDDHCVVVSGEDWARTNTVEEDKEIYGHSHRHLHVAHDCDVLGDKLF